MADINHHVAAELSQASATSFLLLITAAPNWLNQYMYIPSMDSTENVSTIIACYLIATERNLQSCFLTTATALSLVYIEVT
jgi:hypothetical protein